MTTPEDSGDDIARVYRSASDAQAGSPAAATRAAILAEARAATQRRTPAANESRYVWRAAAGIAVLGVAVVLWRQTDHKLAPDLAAAPEDTVAVQSTAVQSPAAAPQPAADVARSDTAGASAPAESRSTTFRMADATAKDEKEMAKAAPVREESSAGLAASNVTASEAPPSVQLARASADAAVPSPPPGAPQAAGAVRQISIDYQQLVQREFPEAWKGDAPPHTVWVVLDTNGTVLRKGELSPGATVTADQPFESQRPWQMVSVVTASGSSLQLAVMSAN